MDELALKIEKLHSLLTDVPIHALRSNNRPSDSKLSHLGPLTLYYSQIRPRQSLNEKNNDLKQYIRIYINIWCLPKVLNFVFHNWFLSPGFSSNLEFDRNNNILYEKEGT